MTELAELEAELARLKQEHRDLDMAIDALESMVAGDQLQIQRLKKRKLSLKDQIIRLEDQLTPDIIECETSAFERTAMPARGGFAIPAEDLKASKPEPRHGASSHCHHQGQPVRLGHHAPRGRDARCARNRLR